METGRKKKKKKTGWHLTLGLKETIYAVVGVVGLMMLCFALGVLAGRGDIYRVAYSWGLMTGPKVATWTPTSEATGGAPIAAAPAPGGGIAPLNPAPVASTPASAATPSRRAAAPKPQRSAPVTGSITPLSPPVPAASAKEKGKAKAAHHNHKTREEELRRMRREVVRKLKFQNSLETAPRVRVHRPKDHNKDRAKSSAKSHSTQVRVARYRNSRSAKAKVAELQKKGIKATLHKTKDSKGTWYTVYKTESHSHGGREKLARKPEKKSGRSSGLVKKPRSE